MDTRSLSVLCVAAFFAPLLIVRPALAQPPLPPTAPPPIVSQATSDPPDPPPGWAGSLGAGWAATRGNSDTSTLNLAYELLRDRGGDLLFKSTGLYLRGD